VDLMEVSWVVMVYCQPLVELLTTLLMDYLESDTPTFSMKLILTGTSSDLLLEICLEPFWATIHALKSMSEISSTSELPLLLVILSPSALPKSELAHLIPDGVHLKDTSVDPHLL